MEKLAHYQIEDLLGEGSFAWVYRAYDQKFDQYVALKILKPNWLGDPQAIARFKQEARTARKLRHPHIVDVYDVGETEGQVYLAQLLIEGNSLADQVARGSLRWDEVVQISRDIGSALDYAHSQGIIHRDVKPQNILLDKNNQAFLGDFGLVRAVESSTHLSSTMSMVGTARYMAPEIWDGKKAIPASDVYALSCVVYEMLTGKVLFEGSSMAAVTKQHIVGPQIPEHWPENVPEGVTDVLRRGLAADPAERVSSAGELATQLAALSAAAKPPSPPLFVPAPDPAAPIGTAKGTAKSGPPWALIGGGALVVLIITMTAFFAWRGSKPIPTEAPIVAPVVELAEEESTATATPDNQATVAAMLTTAAETAEVQSTDTPIPPTNTPIPSTNTPTPVPTPTATSIPPTNTPIPSTNTPTPVPTPTATPKPPTNTPTSTNTPEPPPSGPLPSTITAADGAPMVLVPAGPFTMGSDSGDEQPVHEVTLDAFYIDQYEVTNARYAACEVAGKCEPPVKISSWTRDSYYGNPEYNDYPVIYVNWNQARTYCQWRGDRLPTEAEWEKAARGTDGHGNTYPWGNTFDGNRLNFCDLNCDEDWANQDYDDGYEDTAPVGSYANGVSPYGVYDMVGNVWEWVQSEYRDYPYRADDGRENLDSTNDRVVRGGSWDYSDFFARSAFRDADNPDLQDDDLGFRCVGAAPK